MKKQGYLYECKRCGSKAFLSLESDVFKDGVCLTDCPAGWSFVDYDYLCPCCTDLRNQMMNNFYAPEVKRPLELDDSSREVVNGRVVL